MESFYIWTVGCQMNKADSQRLGTALEQLGLHAVDKAADADVIVLNSCVVRQSAEDKVASHVGAMQPLKKQQPDRVLALMGCMVGPKNDDLARGFPMSTSSCGPRNTVRYWTWWANAWALTGKVALVPWRRPSPTLPVTSRSSTAAI